MRFVLLSLLFAAPAGAAEIVWDDFSSGAQEQFWPGQEFQEWRNNQVRLVQSELFDINRILTSPRVEPVLTSIDTEVAGRLFVRRENPFPATQFQYLTVQYGFGDRGDMRTYDALKPTTFAFDFDFARTTDPVQSFEGHLVLRNRLRLGLVFAQGQFFVDIRIPVSEEPFTLLTSVFHLANSGIVMNEPSFSFPPPRPLETYEVQLSAVRIMFAVPEPSTFALALPCLFWRFRS